jgi:hypothetical protein
MADRSASAPVRIILRVVAIVATAAGLPALIASVGLAQTPASPKTESKAQPKWSVPAAKTAPVKRATSCSAYGEGFVNVPGTDTCIKLGGYVRSEAGVSR